MAGEFDYVGFKIERAVLGRVDSFAKTNALTRSAAVRALLERGLKP